MPLCEGPVEFDGSEEEFGRHERHRVGEAQRLMADAGLRVLAFAYRRLEEGAEPREEEMVLSGLIGLYDPPRPEVPDAVARCRSAGRSRSSW